MTVERIHPKAPVMLIFIAIFTCLPSCINLSNINIYICFIEFYQSWPGKGANKLQRSLV